MDMETCVVINSSNLYFDKNKKLVNLALHVNI